MSYWAGRTPAASNLRLFEAGTGWRKHDDVSDAEGRVTFQGARGVIDQAFSTVLNAGNLIVLTGAGSSFCATNPAGNKQAPGMSDLWNAVEQAATPAVMTSIIDLIPNASTHGSNIEKLLTLCKLYVSLFRDSNATKVEGFIQIAERAILERVDFLELATDISIHRAFVRKIGRRGIRKPRAKIFTTNYDLCFESAAQQQQFVVIDGFSHSVPQVYDRAHFSYDIVRRGSAKEAPDYIENVFHLYKLHGSLDWRRNIERIVRAREASAGEPVLIYPRDSKYQEAFETPYLDMMGAFQVALREPDTALIISGFGFNDDHISKPILAAIEANMSLNLVVCDVAFLLDDDLNGDPEIAPLASSMRVSNTYLQRLKSMASVGDRRITLLNGRFEDIAVAMPDLVAQTERERHADRVAQAQKLATGG